MNNAKLTKNDQIYITGHFFLITMKQRRNAILQPRYEIRQPITTQKKGHIMRQESDVRILLLPGEDN